MKKVGRRDKVEETLFGGITNVFSINRPKVLRKINKPGPDPINKLGQTNANNPKFEN